ncbi:serine/threonine protein kinase [Candidatus Margulisiibacteriota bacterium]
MRKCNPVRYNYAQERIKLNNKTAYTFKPAAFYSNPIDTQSGSVDLGTLRGLLTSMIAGATVSELLYHMPVHGLAWRVQENMEDLDMLGQIGYNHLAPLAIGATLGIIATPLVSKIVGPKDVRDIVKGEIETEENGIRKVEDPITLPRISFDQVQPAVPKAIKASGIIDSGPKALAPAEINKIGPIKPTPSKPVITHKEAKAHDATIAATPSQIVEEELIIESASPQVPSALLESTHKQIDKYIIEEKIAEGGFGRLYKAYDSGVGERRVAIKVMLPGRHEHEDRFIDEIKAIKGLNHPNIVTCFDEGWFKDPESKIDTLYLVLEFIEGKTLKQILEAGKVPVGQSIKYALGTIRALSFANNQGIIHRDINPNNIMIREDDPQLEHHERIKVIDFGLVKKVDVDGRTDADTLLGTIRYMAPEQIEKGIIDHRTDMYCLGLVLYNMLTGIKPYYELDDIQVFEAQTKQYPKGMESYSEFIELNPAVSRGLWQIMRSLLEKDPQNRYATYEELRRDLENELKKIERRRNNG